MTLPLCEYGVPGDPCAASAGIRWGRQYLCALDALLTIGDEAVDVLDVRATIPGKHVGGVEVPTRVASAPSANTKGAFA